MQISLLVLFRLSLWMLHANESAEGGESWKMMMASSYSFHDVPSVQYSNCRDAWFSNGYH